MERRSPCGCSVSQAGQRGRQADARGCSVCWQDTRKGGALPPKIVWGQDTRKGGALPVQSCPHRPLAALDEGPAGKARARGFGDQTRRRAGATAAAAAVLLAVASLVPTSMGAKTRKGGGAYMTAHTTYHASTLDPSDQAVDVFYPETQARGARRRGMRRADEDGFPLISYAHGFSGGGNIDIFAYFPLLHELASWGYIVAATRACNVGCKAAPRDLPFDPPGFGTYYQQQLRVIAFAREQHAQHDAVFAGVNFSCGVGVAGHSMGGQASLFSSSYGNASAADVRSAVIHHAFTHLFPSPQVPFLAFTGEADAVAAASMTEAFFAAAGGPYGCDGCARGLVDVKSAGHLHPLTDFVRVAFFTAAWFKLFLDCRTQDLGVDWDDAVFGNSSGSLCTGGGGDMTRCVLHRGVSRCRNP